MVIFFEWHRTAMDQKSRSGLPMTGEDAGLGALASPLVGYLGKVQERAASLECCPWCTSKGLTFALRSYRINFQDSITLCTNPQCLFPLVSRSLEDVLANLDRGKPAVGNKRKNASPLEKEELIEPAFKRLRSSEPDSFGPQSTADSLKGHEEHGAADVVCNGQHPQGEKVNGYHSDSTRDWDDVMATEQGNAARTDGYSPTCSASAGHPESPSDVFMTTNGDSPALFPLFGALGIPEADDDFTEPKSSEALNGFCSLDSSQSVFTSGGACSTEINAPSPEDNDKTAGAALKSAATDVSTCSDVRGIKLDTVTGSDDLVPVPNHLFWRNSDNLCWLDSVLVALVKCKNLRKCKPKDEPQRSPVWRLIEGYEDVCAAFQVHQQPGRDGVPVVPNRVLQKAEAHLHGLRMSVFKLLQPRLHCMLGQKETPVFALPLLLAADSWAEPLFLSTFHWEFKCGGCKSATKERVQKTLPTFTNIAPDWRPLHATHLAPCNVCHAKNQRRTMTLDRLPPVFVLHFVNGLPDNDARNYAFTFKGKRYSISTVLQYDQRLKHFVTWVSNSDGSWLEYDDLKPHCKTHQALPVPAEEIHVVFWEAEEDKDPPPCSPSSTEPPPSNLINPSPSNLKADEASALIECHSDIVSALLEPEGCGSPTAAAAAGLDASIGSTTLLDTFEGLTHSDIVTLTLVEINPESDAPPVHKDTPPLEPSAPSRTQSLDPAPDSSSAVSEPPLGLCAEPPAASSCTSSDPEDDARSDPTFVPVACRGRGRGRGRPAGRQGGKKAASDVPPPTPSGPSNSKLAAQDNSPPVEMTPVSQTNAQTVSAALKMAAAPREPLQNSRWSFLLSKHPLQVARKPADKPAPVVAAPVKPAPPAHSTPIPVRRQPVPAAALPRPQLMKEQNEGLPLKAAEMYDAFGAKGSPAPGGEVRPAEFLCVKPPPPAFSHPKLLTRPSVATPPPPPRTTPEISSSKKHHSSSSKLPAGLTDTEALRYKLMKKLKAKKKKLAKLNEMLGHQGVAGFRPDSTDLTSPNTVTSSTYDGTTSEDFLSDLLSPATTASNLSPDSTDFLEMLAGGQDGGEQVDGGVAAIGAANARVNEADAQDFLEDFLLQAVAQRPTEMESEALSALELFV